jgi:hypothetical protein
MDVIAMSGYRGGGASAINGSQAHGAFDRFGPPAAA